MSLDDDDDGDDDDVAAYGETSTGYPPALDLAWSIVSNDPSGEKTPTKLHKAAVECMIRAMEQHCPEPESA